MTYAVRFTPEAEADLIRLYDSSWCVTRATAVLADRALDAIRHGVEHLSRSPFNCRKAYPGNNTYLRELIIAFGASGYVALFEIEPGEIVTVLAVRHQREEDFY